ncbi:MAG: hypothetical protein IPJ65_03485 [Archangiaceae bacterium]|nr:hypothetical protein [Archangiaceae bacterium]
MVLTSGVVAGVGTLLGVDWRIATAVGMTLAMSSTAIVLVAVRARAARDARRAVGVLGAAVSRRR